MEHAITFLTVDQWVVMSDGDPLIYAHVFSAHDRATARVASCTCGWECMAWGERRLVIVATDHVRSSLLSFVS
jgi:hypothetical protein